MPNITLKNIPEPLYEQLKTAASLHRRSLNSEILQCLEQAVGARRVDVSARIESARTLREKTARYRISGAELDEARKSGRP
jgi:plasmid stability protein